MSQYSDELNTSKIVHQEPTIGRGLSRDTESEPRSIVAVGVFLILIPIMTWLLMTVFKSRVAIGELRANARIAFMSNRDGNFEIYVMDRDGGNLINLTNHPAQDGLPAWSREAQLFTFLTTRDSQNQVTLYNIEEDGSNPRAINIGETFNPSAPIWSPTGEWLAVEVGDQNFSDIYIIDQLGENILNVTESVSFDSFGDWSPDGRQIVMTSDREGVFSIYSINIEDGSINRLTDGAQNNAQPAISPDGSLIAFLSDRDQDLEIYIMDALGTNVRRLTSSPGFDGFPAWSPDGLKIAFISVRDGNSEIYTIDVDGSNMLNITNTPLIQEAVRGDFSWSPDGSQILYQTEEEGNLEVYVINRDGSNKVNLTNHPANDLASIWVP